MYVKEIHYLHLAVKANRTLDHIQVRSRYGATVKLILDTLYQKKYYQDLYFLEDRNKPYFWVRGRGERTRATYRGGVAQNKILDRN